MFINIDRQYFEQYCNQIKSERRLICVSDIDTNIITASAGFALHFGFKLTSKFYMRSYLDVLYKDTSPLLSDIEIELLKNYRNKLFKTGSTAGIIVDKCNNYFWGKSSLIVDTLNVGYAIEIELTALNSMEFNVSVFDKMSHRYGVYHAETINIFDIKLSEIEESIIFFLLSGYTVSDIAACFNISRSRINNIVADSLCPIFNISGGSSRFLKEKLIASGFYVFMPHRILFSKNYQQFDKLLSFDTIKFKSDIHKQIAQLLVANFTQHEIADKIDLSRALVAKIIYNEIYPLFDIVSSKCIKILPSVGGNNSNSRTSIVKPLSSFL